MHSLTYALHGSEWSASRPGHFTPREKSSWYPLDWSLGGPQGRSGCCGERKNSQLLPGLEHPITQSIAQRYTTEQSQLTNLITSMLFSRKFDLMLFV
jgi:hypothetical protein